MTVSAVAWQPYWLTKEMLKIKVNDLWSHRYNNPKGEGVLFHTVAQWAQMEAAGAMFLPAAGYSKDGFFGGISSGGNYWSSTVRPLNNDAFGFYFDFRGLYRGFSSRYDGRAVRAVCQLTIFEEGKNY